MGDGLHKILAWGNDDRNDFMSNFFKSYVAKLGFKLATTGSGPVVIKLFSCSTQLSMKISLLINKFENANNSWHFHIY